MYQNFKYKLIHKKKLVEPVLKIIFGLNSYSIKYLCAKCGIPLIIKVCDIPNSFLENLVIQANELFLIELCLVQERYKRFSILPKIKNWKYVRFKKKLPVRGQRTHSNAQTCKRMDFYNKYVSNSKNIILYNKPPSMILR